MNRIEKTFAAGKQSGKGVYVAYLTMGAPTPEKSIEAVEEVIKEGAGIIELGVPFSDPVADGEVIRRAANLALANNVTLADVLGYVKILRARHSETPFVLFSYYNPIYQYGLKKFAKDAAAAGIDAVLVVDLPLEERGELLEALRPEGLTMVPLVTPTTGPERVKASAEGLEDSFMYAVTVNGVTGQRKQLPPELSQRLVEIKKLVKMPVVAGFGIGSPEEGRMIAEHCDGFVIGSALVRRFVFGK